MQLIRDISTLPAGAKGAAVALGNFDGLHLGHRAILQETLKRAESLKVPSAVMTFEPHPREFFKPEAPPLTLMRLTAKLAALETMGFDYVFLLPFHAALAATGAEDFIRKYLVEALAAKAVITGENFHFGSKRSGNHATLAAAGGFTYVAVPPITNDAGVISSTAIRALLSEGKVDAIPHFLGHPFEITGEVAHGEKRGRELGFPTANLALSGMFLPRAGVYKVRAQVDGKEYDGVANIGNRPTVGGTEPRAEAHLFDFSGDIYGKELRLQLVSFLRDEKKFESLDALKIQIAQDAKEARSA